MIDIGTLKVIVIVILLGGFTGVVDGHGNGGVDPSPMKRIVR